MRYTFLKFLHIQGKPPFSMSLDRTVPVLPVRLIRPPLSRIRRIPTPPKQSGTDSPNCTTPHYRNT
eukprot:3028070-Rhodomonas_salina.1